MLKTAVHPQRLRWKHSIFHEHIEMFKVFKLIGINQSESMQFGGDSAVLPVPEDINKTHFHLYLRLLRHWDSLSERPEQPICPCEDMILWTHLSKVLAVPFLMDINTQTVTPQLTTFYGDIKLFSILAHNSPCSERKQEREREREKHLKYLFSKSPSLKHIPTL